MPATGRQLLAQRQASSKPSALPDAPWPSDLVVGILTGGRPSLLAETVGNFFSHVGSNEICGAVALVNGADKASLAVLEPMPVHIVVHEGPMLPIGAACARLVSELPNPAGSVYLHLEDDWEIRGDLRRHIAAGARLLSEVGHVKLRAFADNRNMRNVWGGAMSWEMRGKWYWTSTNSHFTFNPALTRMDVAREVFRCAGERDAQDKYRATGLEIAQVFPGCFFHNDHGHSMRREKNLGHRDGETFT
jgi:hypothetical protein